MRILLAFAVALALLVGALWLPEVRETRSALRRFEVRESAYSAPEWEGDVAPLAEPRHGPLLEQFEAARRAERPIPAEPSRLPRATLAGRVLRWDGAPAVGARVELECSAPFRSTLAPLASATVAADGSFRLEGPGSGPFRVTACLELARVERDPLAAGSEGLELVLPAPCTLQLRVVDDRGQRLESFTVRTQPLAKNPAASGDWREDFARDAHGALELAELTPGDWRLRVASPGFLADVRVLSLPLVEGVTITLRREARVSGLVLDARGAPVAHAEVAASSALEPSGWVRASQKSTSDARGRFELRPPVGDELEIRARLGDALSPAQHVVLAPGEELELRLELAPPAVDDELDDALVGAAAEASCAVSGRVSDENGAPLAGLVVHAFDVDGALTRSATTDEDGVYRLELAAGRARLHVGEEPGERAFLAAADAFVRLELGGVRSNVDFALRRAGVLAGVVRFAPGSAPGLAQISVRARGQTVDTLTELDANGRFRVASLAAGPHWVSAIGRDAFGRLCASARTFEVDVSAGQDTSIALDLLPATLVRVRLTDGAGASVAAELEALDPRGWALGPHLGADGLREFVLPPHDPFLLRARRDGRVFESESSCSTGEVELTFRLE